MARQGAEQGVKPEFRRIIGNIWWEGRVHKRERWRRRSARKRRPLTGNWPVKSHSKAEKFQGNYLFDRGC